MLMHVIAYTYQLHLILTSARINPEIALPLTRPILSQASMLNANSLTYKQEEWTSILL